jgi:hypothetical protein
MPGVISHGTAFDRILAIRAHELDRAIDLFYPVEAPEAGRRRRVDGGR